MKQLLLRVPDDLHRQLRERCEREGRSANSIAIELLGEAMENDDASMQERIIARARALRLLPNESRPSSAVPSISEVWEVLAHVEVGADELLAVDDDLS